MDFRTLSSKLSIAITDHHLKQFEEYYHLLIAWNQKFNLTAITDCDEVYIKHFYDSLLMTKVIDLSLVKTLCDIGSGAGFPSIPIKIVFPHLEITIIEPTGKRALFLTEVVNKLGLTNVTILNERAENIAGDYREHFDVVTARAVAKLTILLELSFSYVKLGNIFIAYKSNNYQEEIMEAGEAIKTLGGQLDGVYEMDLPFDFGGRSLIKVKKVNITPNDYPRSYVKIKSKPLSIGGNKYGKSNSHR